MTPLAPRCLLSHLFLLLILPFLAFRLSVGRFVFSHFFFARKSFLCSLALARELLVNNICALFEREGQQANSRGPEAPPGQQKGMLLSRI